MSNSDIRYYLNQLKNRRYFYIRGVVGHDLVGEYLQFCSRKKINFEFISKPSVATIQATVSASILKIYDVSNLSEEKLIQLLTLNPKGLLLDNARRTLTSPLKKIASSTLQNSVTYIEKSSTLLPFTHSGFVQEMCVDNNSYGDWLLSRVPTFNNRTPRHEYIIPELVPVHFQSLTRVLHEMSAEAFTLFSTLSYFTGEISFQTCQTLGHVLRLRSTKNVLEELVFCGAVALKEPVVEVSTLLAACVVFDSRWSDQHKGLYVDIITQDAQRFEEPYGPMSALPSYESIDYSRSIEYLMRDGIHTSEDEKKILQLLSAFLAINTNHLPRDLELLYEIELSFIDAGLELSLSQKEASDFLKQNHRFVEGEPDASLPVGFGMLYHSTRAETVAKLQHREDYPDGVRALVARWNIHFDLEHLKMTPEVIRSNIHALREYQIIRLYETVERGLWAEAEDIIRTCELSRNEVNPYFQGYLGNYWREQGWLSEAIKCYRLAIEIFRSHKDHRFEGVYLMDVGIAYARHRLWADAVRTFESALRVLIEQPSMVFAKEVSKAYLYLLKEHDAHRAEQSINDVLDFGHRAYGVTKQDGMHIRLWEEIIQKWRGERSRHNEMYIFNGDEYVLGETASISLSETKGRILFALHHAQLFRHGTYLSPKEIGKVVWNDRPRTKSLLNRIRVEIKGLRDILGRDHVESKRGQGYRLSNDILLSVAADTSFEDTVLRYGRS